MVIDGKFEVDLTPQNDAGFPAGRMLINKTYTGGLQGVGAGQMISKRADSGAAAYYAIEEFSGLVSGKHGAFTLIHKGYMDEKSQSLDVTILEGSGTDELQGISGSMLITQDDNGHSFEFTYEL